jgi:hypothetical protein
MNWGRQPDHQQAYSCQCYAAVELNIGQNRKRQLAFADFADFLAVFSALLRQRERDWLAGFGGAVSGNHDFHRA